MLNPNIHISKKLEKYLGVCRPPEVKDVIIMLILWEKEEK
jgi:hypothetical protein